ncbi:RNA-guided endonuclease TnpB family protein [Streptomyces flaveolus]|uniref:RNA-guided endonuclease TnpB family protein n=1 Tax=Streptomyces flaveolus TaxID=67297 RepID=UPI0033F8C9C0
MWAKELESVFARVAGRFSRVDLRWRMRDYVRGLLAPVSGRTAGSRPSMQVTTGQAGFQRLLNGASWDADAVRDGMQRVAERLGTPGGVLIVDDTGFPKKRTASTRVKWSRSLPSTPSTVSVVKDSAGRYFASFVVGTGPEEEIWPKSTPGVGIDLGLGHFAVLPDGRKIDSPRFMRRAAKRLRKAQRALSRKEKGSKNRDKARIRVARAHARVADARREFHHQLSTRLLRDNQAIAVESLAVKGLARTRLAKSVHDAGWSAFVTMLEYKAARYGRTLIRIGRFEPTSQVCSQCGFKDGPKPLHVRMWTCGACGAVLDRDINAAVNVAKAAGLAVTACGAQVRRAPVPAPRNEAGTHPTPQPPTGW